MKVIGLEKKREGNQLGRTKNTKNKNRNCDEEEEEKSDEY